MAFNPFHSFRKYQKYWMAGAVLVCMLTFVLCSSGMRGTGLDDWFLKTFGGRRGEVLVKINGKNYYSDDIAELKNQRIVANDYMLKLSEIAVKRLTAIIKDTEMAGDTDEQNKMAMSLLSLRKTCLNDLFTKLNRDSRFFRGGTKLDDLIEFILWRDLADKYKIQVTDDVARDLVRNAVHGYNPWWDYETSEAEFQAFYEIRHAAHYGASDKLILNALKQEFRVQIAQLAYIARRSPGSAGERDQFANIPYKAGDLHIYLNTPMQARVAPTPEQLSAHYRTMRTELTIDLLPVSLEALAAKVKLPEDHKARLELLKKFYDDHAKAPFNPTLDTPGFMFPARAEIQLLAADASMEYYKQPARVVSVLEKTPPVGFNAMSPLLGGLGWLATPPAWEASLQRNLENERGTAERDGENRYRVLTIYNDKYLNETNEKEKGGIKLFYESLLNNPSPPYKNSASSWITPNYYSPGQFNEALAKPGATYAASLVSGVYAEPLAGLVAYQQGAYNMQAKKIAAMVAFDKTKREQVGAELFLARVPQFNGFGAFTGAGLTYYAGLKPQFLPIAGYLEDQLRTKIEEELAQKWVNATMLDVKKQLEVVKGRTSEAFDRQVNELMKKYSTETVDAMRKKKLLQGLRFAETSQLRNEYDVDQDENLNLLRDSFDKYRVSINQIEGRGGKPEMLREGDFYKLIFGTEKLGLGPVEPFYPKVWPPSVTVPKWRESPLAQKSLEQRLFDTAEKPIVFWKSVKRGSEPLEWKPNDPKMLEIVEKQYRFNEARTNLLPEAKKVAEEVKKVQQSEGKDIGQTMRELAKKHGTELVTLNKVATLVENPDRRAADPVSYVDYALPRGKVPFPRPDMVKQLLALRDLSNPLKVDAEESEKSSKAAATDAAANRAKADLEELNKINANLFSSDLAASPKSKTHQVQVLTNKPRDIYYIATVAGYTEPSSYGYLMGDFTPQAFSKDVSQFAFPDQVQQDAGKEMFRLAVQQLRSRAEVEISEQARKQYADETQ